LTDLELSEVDRRTLLRVAREAARARLAGKAPKESVERVAGDFGGAFVTLMRGERLRGCVGTFTPTSDIVATIQRVTCSALEDARFVTCPVEAEDLDRLTIEIYLLTRPVRTERPADLTVGVHGVVVRRGDRSGGFLPKVAVERGWSVEEFLGQCCTMKAGLAVDAWKSPGTEVLLFEADVFNDSPGGEATR